MEKQTKKEKTRNSTSDKIQSLYCKLNLMDWILSDCHLALLRLARNVLLHDFLGGTEGGPPPPPRLFKTATWVLKVFPLAPIQELYCTTFNYAGGDREQQDFCQY